MSNQAQRKKGSHQEHDNGVPDGFGGADFYPAGQDSDGEDKKEVGDIRANEVADSQGEILVGSRG